MRMNIFSSPHMYMVCTVHNCIIVWMSHTLPIPLLMDIQIAALVFYWVVINIERGMTLKKFFSDPRAEELLSHFMTLTHWTIWQYFIWPKHNYFPLTYSEQNSERGKSTSRWPERCPAVMKSGWKGPCSVRSLLVLSIISYLTCKTELY